jgi:hypothetical protein
MTTTTPTNFHGYHSRPTHERILIDEAALLDVMNAYDSPYWTDRHGELDAQAAAIRARIPDKGERLAARINAGVRYIRAAPDYRDPPGTIRYAIVHPDGRRNPARAHTTDDQGAE